MTARTSVAAASSRNASRSAVSIGIVIALRFSGRLSVRVTTSPSRAVNSTSSCIVTSRECRRCVGARGAVAAAGGRSVGVLQLARLREDRDVVVVDVGEARADAGAQLGAAAAQKRIGRFLLGDRRRHRRLSLGAQTLDVRELCRDRGVSRLQLMREAKVLQIVEGTNQIQRLVIGRALTR